MGGGYGYGYGYNRYRGPYRYNTRYYRPAVNTMALAEMQQYQKLVSDINAASQRGTFAGGSETTHLARDLSSAVKPPLRHDTLQTQRLASDLVSALSNRSRNHTVDAPSLARSLMININHGRLPYVEGSGMVHPAESVADTEQILRYSGASRPAARAVTTDLKSMLRL